MAIIRSNNEAAELVTRVWAVAALGRLRENLALARIVNTDTGDEIAEQGDTITIHKRGTLTPQSPAEDAPLVPEAPSNTKVDLTLDTYRAVSWRVSDKTRTTAVQSGLDYVMDAAGQLAEEVEKSLAGLYTQSANADVGTYGVDLSLATITAARQGLNVANVPRGDRHLFISSKDDTALLDTDQLTDVDRSGMSGALREGVLGRLRGFMVHSSNLVTETGPVAYVDVVGTTDGVMEITINGEVATYTAASDTAQAISDALVTDINANAGAGAVVTASNAGGTTTLITITADVVGVDFTIELGGAQVANLDLDSRGVHSEYHNLAMHSNGLALATRPLALPPNGSGALGTIIVDEDSGIALRVMQQYSLIDRGLVASVDILYGVVENDARLFLEMRS